MTTILLTPAGATRRAEVVWHRATWVLAGIAMIAMLLWPAFYNRYPLIFHDTGGYIISAVDGVLVSGRSALYGALLALTIPLDFWPVIVAQAAVMAWLVAVLLRVHGLGGRPWLAVGMMLGLAVLTSLPWSTAQLMPDVLVPAAVLAIYLLTFHSTLLGRREMLALGMLTAVSIASHMSILALALGLLATLGLFGLAARFIRWPRPRLQAPAIAVVAGVALSLVSNVVMTHRFAFTPGGANFIFARLMQDGIISRYLADKCPDASIRLCAYRNEVAGTADEWLWEDPSPLKKLGGWESYEDEAARIIRETLVLYPWQHLKAAAQNTVAQFIQAATGDGLTPWMWHAQWVIKTYAPGRYERFMAAREQNEMFAFDLLNVLHIPVWALSVAALPLLIAMRRVRRRAAVLCAFVLITLIGNAAICGIFSGPHDRYQSRIVPIAPIAVVIAWLTLRPPRLRALGQS